MIYDYWEYELMSETDVIAVDGPSASGKSTVSKQVAEKLGYIYVDSGALYRGITWLAVQRNLDVKNKPSVAALAALTRWHFFIKDGAVRFTVDEQDPGDAIRGQAVRERVSDVAAVPEVRRCIVDKLREMVRLGPLVIEGRDIGSVVFPSTPYKFYLDADPEERARRRCQELVKTEGSGTVEEVYHSLQKRDKKDSTRKTAPLQIALGADVINSTGMSIDEVVEYIVTKYETARITDE